MPKETINDLVKFLMPYPGHVQKTALWLREFVWDLYPESNELIYDNTYTVAFGWSPTDSAGDAFCSIAVFSNYCNFGFNRGSEIRNPGNILLGNGSLYRFIRVLDFNDFPQEFITERLAEAYENSMGRLKPGKKILKGQTIVKSISPVKKRPK